MNAIIVGKVFLILFILHANLKYVLITVLAICHCIGVGNV